MLARIELLTRVAQELRLPRGSVLQVGQLRHSQISVPLSASAAGQGIRKIYRG